MIAPPNAMSNGDGSATGAFAAFTGMSAANAGTAASAKAATEESIIFFMAPAPFQHDRPCTDVFAAARRSGTAAKLSPAPRRRHKRAVKFRPLACFRQAENSGNCCLFGRLPRHVKENRRLLRRCHMSRLPLSLAGEEGQGPILRPGGKADGMGFALQREA